MTYVLVASAAIGGVLLFLLATATANSPFFSEYYPVLLWLNVAVAAALLALVVYQLVRLARQRRAKVFGSLLTFRVLVMFALVGIVPGLLVYLVSLQFLVKSIDSWFDVRVEKALEGGLNLGRAALDAMLSDLVLKAQVMALDLSGMPAAQQATALTRLREQVGTEDAVILTPGGTVLATASRDFDKLVPSPPSAQALRRARTNRGYGAVEMVGEKALVLRVIVPIDSFALADESRFLQLTHSVAQSLADHGAQVQTVYRAWRELQLSRDGLKQIYILTLTLTLLLAMFSWFALAFLLSRRLSQPLANLAEATQAVAQGDFSRRPPVTSRDELGILTQSFNSMTEQLDEARYAAQRNQAQLETANAYLESILASLSTGVLVFDRDLHLRISNTGAGSILQQDFTPLVGLELARWTRLESFAGTVRDEFGRHPDSPWHVQFEIPGSGLVLLVRGSPLPVASGGGYVVVFDDISQLIAAQRASAWGEVARRLAHEIKNPLTPIQLAAERLQIKLAGKLPADDAQALNRATDTIIVQVTALKNMVDDFRDYARAPAAQLEALDLNGLIAEVLMLYEQSATLVQTRLQPALPQVRGDADQLRQVIHNLLQNAQDALSGSADPRIELSTRQAGGQAWLDIADNGCGFPEAIIKRAFEPYVTTKPKGTGLGLAIVKRIIDEHHGSISVENGASRGAAVRISLPLAA
ncbi:MAG: HAMP domain-containing protein [Betaproteobacteria bacterium]|nr:HAMP domain-containing protein [Betaproteobacteria bacterium]